MSPFERPSFLRENINATKDPSEGQPSRQIPGSRADVVELSDVSSEVSEKIPEGRVLKRYRNDEWVQKWEEEFIGEEGFDYRLNHRDSDLHRVLTVARYEVANASSDTESDKIQKNIFTRLHRTDERIEDAFISGVLETYSLPSIAKKLKARHEEISGQFKDVLPDIIVPTDYIVGSDQDPTINSRRPSRHVYEFQPKVVGVTLPVSGVRDFLYEEHFLSGSAREGVRLLKYVGKAKEFVKDAYTPEKLAEIKRELQLFVDVAQEIPRKTGLLPADIVYPSNVFFTKNGIRIIDNNAAARIPKQGDTPLDQNLVDTLQHYKKGYNSLIEMWRVLAREL